MQKPNSNNFDCSKKLLSIVSTKNTELLFLSLFLKLLKPGGRASIIVPEGVLFKSNESNKKLRKICQKELNQRITEKNVGVLVLHD